MKTKLIKSEEPKQFKPFTVEFTVETIQEARALFHVTNCYDIMDHLHNGGYEIVMFNPSDDVAKEIGDNIYREIQDAIESQGFEI